MLTGCNCMLFISLESVLPGFTKILLFSYWYKTLAVSRCTPVFEVDLLSHRNCQQNG
jgi:hypothetical protein